MKNKSLFDNLFVFDMANNHQGKLQHGKVIINQIAKVCREKNVKGAIKFQYRQLETFIHPDFKAATTPKHIPRFLTTRLSNEEFKVLVEEVKQSGLLAMCTPFDEESVDVIAQHKIDIIKIASCSAQDWPLLEKVATIKKPVVCSTAGLAVKEIDNIVSFFGHRKIQFAIMHCIAIYPTPPQSLQLNQIDVLKNRYPFLPIGFSTHEEPDNVAAVKIAVAKGAQILERHVGVETDKISLNAYSSKPGQIASWIDAALEARVMCGKNKRQLLEAEIDSLNSLKRGGYIRKDLAKGEPVNVSDVFFAMPYQAGQLFSGDFIPEVISNRVYKRNEALDEQLGKKYQANVNEILYSCIHEAKGMLYQARIALGQQFRVELSHHFGIEHFKKAGAFIIDVINREYCKKLIIQVAGQYHPTHSHKKKEETFQVLWGQLNITIEGTENTLEPGDQITILRGQKHSFKTEKGVICEEISTTHHQDDSFYEDERVPVEKNLRKTELETGMIAFEQYDFHF